MEDITIEGSSNTNIMSMASAEDVVKSVILNSTAFIDIDD